jgi:hypothetical protein
MPRRLTPPDDGAFLRDGNQVSTEALNPPSKRECAPRRNAMLKTCLLAAYTSALLLAPAYAGASKECTDKHMKQMHEMIAKMNDPARQKQAKAALDKSEAGMKAGNDAACMKYMNQAHKAMGL